MRTKKGRADINRSHKTSEKIFFVARGDNSQNTKSRSENVIAQVR